MLGLPDQVTACLFDLDGVLTPTAAVHNAAWTKVFDELLRSWSAQTGQPFVPFDPAGDYRSYVDGRPRVDGVRAFLASRGIRLPEGDPDDPPDAQTVHGVGRRKNDLLLQLIRTRGVQAYPGSVRYLHAARDAGLGRAVVTASANGAEVLAATGLADLVQVRVDAQLAARLELRGKPHPDTFLAAAQLLAVPPEQAAVFEDSLAGVEAGRIGGFGCIVGVDRVGQTEALLAHGASLVVHDLAELLP